MNEGCQTSGKRKMNSERVKGKDELTANAFQEVIEMLFPRLLGDAGLRLARLSQKQLLPSGRTAKNGTALKAAIEAVPPSDLPTGIVASRFSCAVRNGKSTASECNT